MKGAWRVPDSSGNYSYPPHLVTPKGDGDVELFLNTTEPQVSCTWTSDPPGMVTPDPTNACRAYVARANTARVKVKVTYQVNGWEAREHEFNIWIIWAHLEVVPPDPTDPDAVGDFYAWASEPPLVTNIHQPAGIMQHACIRFRATIEPAAIITDVDRPGIEQQAPVEVPGADRKHVSWKVPLRNGDRKVDQTGNALTEPSRWDMSRQSRVKILNSYPVPVPPLWEAGTELLHAGQPTEEAIPEDYPGSDFQGTGVIGNDDCWNNQAHTDPYVAYVPPAGSDLIPQTQVSQRASADTPRMGILHEVGAPVYDGATVEYRNHFREFVRVVLGGGWMRISDYSPWRLHFKFENRNGTWVHGQHEYATDNEGWV